MVLIKINKILRNRLPILLIFVLFLALFIPKSYAWSWGDAQNNAYQNAYNVSIQSWSFNTLYGSKYYIGAPADYALINLSIIGNPSQIQVIGYTNGNIKLGVVPYWIVSSTSNSVILLVPYTTAADIPWNTITVFFNPNKIVTSAPNLYYPNLAYNAVNIRMPNITYTQYNLGGLNPKITPPYIGAPVKFNFTELTYSPQQAFVILANHSLGSDKFNLSWFSDSLHGYSISNTPNNKYRLLSYGTFGSTMLSNAPLNNIDANFIFNGILPYDNLGFEAYLSLTANQVYTEGIIANESDIRAGVLGTMFNFTSTNSLGLDINLQSGQVGLNISNSIPTTLYVLPAFTRAFSNSILLTNPNTNGVVLNSSFLFRTSVTNINWTYNFTQYAYPSNSNMPYTFVYNSGQVGYLLLNITHDIGKFGINCDHLELVTQKQATAPFGDPIPFYVLSSSCNPNGGYMKILISNISKAGYTFTSLWIYSGAVSTINQYPDIYSSWQFASGNQFTYNSQIITIPSVVTLSNPLNIYSNVLVCDFAPMSACNMGQLGISGSAVVNFNNQNNAYTMTGYSLGHTNIGVLTDKRFTNTFIVDPSTFYPLGIVYSKYLFVKSGSSYSLQNTTNALTINLANGAFISYNVFLSNGITATAQRIWTQQALQGNTYLVTTNQSIITNLSIGITQTVPPSPNELNLTNQTTTISFNSLSNPVYLLDTNISLPFYILVTLAIIFVIIGAFTLSSHQHGDMGFIFVIVAIWILGIWQFAVLILAMVISVMFILYEFTEKRGS